MTYMKNSHISYLQYLSSCPVRFRDNGIHVILAPNPVAVGLPSSLVWLASQIIIFKVDVEHIPFSCPCDSSLRFSFLRQLQSLILPCRFDAAS
jgi:hypothetical protein